MKYLYIFQVVIDIIYKTFPPFYDVIYYNMHPDGFSW